MIVLLSVYGPVKIVTGAEPAAAFPAWMLPVVFGAAGLAAVGTWAWVSYRRRAARNVNEHAFRALASELGLGRGTRQMVRRLAACHGAASPVGLLVSEDALRVALGQFERAGLAKRDQRAVDLLRRAFGL